MRDYLIIHNIKMIDSFNIILYCFIKNREEKENVVF